MQMLRRLFKFICSKIKHSSFLCGLQIGFVGRLVFVLITPAILTLLMFNPFIKIELKSNTNETQYLSRTEINENLTSSVLAEFFQTSLQLDWYQICFENQGAVSIGDRTVVNPQNVRGDDRGNVQIRVKEELPSPFIVYEKKLTARPYEKADCLRINGNIGGMSVGTSTISLGARINDTLEDITFLGDNKFELKMSFDFTKAHLYIKQDWLSLLVKYLVLLVLWSSLILLTRSIGRYLL